MPGGGDGIAEHWSMAPRVSHNNAGSGAAHGGTTLNCTQPKESDGINLSAEAFIFPPFCFIKGESCGVVLFIDEDYLCESTRFI